jgi:hypothetical protein
LVYYGYRYYSPGLGRWVSRDPIGERGGLALYCNSKNDMCRRSDVLGLFFLGMEYTDGLYSVGNHVGDQAQWLALKSGGGLATFVLATEAMNHADGTKTPLNWNLDSTQTSLTILQTEYNAKHILTGQEYNDWFRNYIKTVYSSLPTGNYSLSIPNQNFHYKKPSDGYYAFGDARLKHDGTVCVRHIFFTFVNVVVNVVLTDRYTFEGYEAQGRTSLIMPTAVGFRLQDTLWIRPFDTKAEWTRKRDYVFW